MNLGANYSKDATSFALFSPVAKSVSVILYEKGDGGNVIKRVPMIKVQSEDDIYAVSIDGDLDGVYYTYEVTLPSGVVTESHDPYARACGVNGHRSMVVDLESTDPDGFVGEVIPKLEDPMGMIITEVSVADVSSDASAGSEYPGKFKAFTERHIIDYFKDMGVTHIQLMPSYDFASIDEADTAKPQYNWGYDPYNYNVPEGSYSTDPFDGAVRIREFKEMVQSIHNAGMGVIMDVVYNHTFDIHGSCFYKTAGDYFYRKNGDKFSDASACGNEIASEQPMVRKYIIDSLCYWADEYHIDGFRFDLMGVLDIETLNLAREALLKINPDIILYGEGWTGGDSTLPAAKRGMKDNAPKLLGYGMFSDDIRDVVKGHVFYMDELGFVNGGENLESDLKQAVICPKWAKDPRQSINYLSCHDNYTLWDRLIVSNSDESEKIRLCMNRLAAAILFSSQGIPFFLMGEEFARTKPSDDEGKPVENSYNSSVTVNSIKYDRAKDFSELRDYYKGLIRMRKAHKAFRLDSIDQIHQAVSFIDDVPDNVVAYTIRMPDEEIFIVFNANRNKISIEFPDAGDENSIWDVIVDAKTAGDKSLYTLKNQAIIPEVSCLIAVKKLK